MHADEIRTRFLRFFEARDHTIVPSASLIPVDPTLLLTNAGMVPFKPFMLGEETPPYLRAATVQKCARTVDIDVVGTTARHLTFFEMLGNFSFGDYFKEKAVPWAYELVTEHFEMDPDRLWFTVHETDDEAAEIWLDGVGIPPDRLQRRGDEDNFWQMGVPGPCGPSSEIFFDKGPEYGPDGGPIVDEERFMEVWNLVFMQNVQDEPYHVVGDLPAKNIDTGAGLDRLAAVLQGVESVFEADHLRSVVAAAEGLTGVRLGAAERTDVSLRILADHGRAVTFLIADGVVPSNEGRGYVLRRLLRRAVRHAFLFDAKDLALPRLIDATLESMRTAYPGLGERRDFIMDMAEREELQFRRTLQSGHQLLDDALEDLDEGAAFPGATAFKLHDTFGFPKELTEEILSERGIRLDLEEFDRMMQEQRERARRSFKGGDAAERADAYRSLLRGVDATTFTGYQETADRGRVLAIVREGETVERAEEGQTIELFLDRTPFYAESGGQVGDTGLVETETGTVAVDDTQYSLPGLHGHRGKVTRGFIRTGQDAAARVHEVKRERIRKNHTGTHVLHWALRDIVGDHVHQAGSLVADDRLRFDFSHYAALQSEELEAVERAVNERLIENARVDTLETSRQEAEAMGALAFFGDKYGDQVRVVRIGDYSTEFCGGTHVPTVGQVGPLLLVSEGSVAANTRRVEALTGARAYDHILELRRRLAATAAALKTQPHQVVSAATTLADRLDEHQDRLARFEAESRSRLAATMMDQAETHEGHTAVVGDAGDMAGDELRSLALQLRDRIGSGGGVVGARNEGKGALVGFVTADLVDGGVSAGEIIAAAARVLGGGGSRDPELAQAGGPHGDRMEEALATARASLRDALASM